MPKLSLNLPPPSVPWTRIPNSVLDRLLPQLSDTELRVLLILIRQTLGWQHGSLRTALTYQSLMRRTGRGRGAVATALRDLEARGVIHRLRAAAHLVDRNSVRERAGNRYANSRK